MYVIFYDHHDIKREYKAQRNLPNFRLSKIWLIQIQELSLKEKLDPYFLQKCLNTGISGPQTKFQPPY